MLLALDGSRYYRQGCGARRLRRYKQLLLLLLLLLLHAWQLCQVVTKFLHAVSIDVVAH
jgi:hypothetical protein